MLRKAKYQDPDTTITLREGIDEHYRANPQLFLPAGFPRETVEFFRRHDCIHVLFGCSTSFLDETRADWWTILGTDVGMIRYLMEAAKGPIRALYRDLSGKMNEADRARYKAEIKRDGLAALATPLEIFKRSRKMTKKWPWRAGDAFLDRPLNELRQEFNIQM